MKFIDANVFLYAFLKVKTTPDGKTAKESSQRIISRVQNGERVFTTVVHLSEVANVAEDKMPFEQQKRMFDSIMLNDSIEVRQVDKPLYELAIGFAMDKKMGVNDALAAIIMQKENISEIYSFDSDFDDIQSVKRLTE